MVPLSRGGYLLPPQLESGSRRGKHETTWYPLLPAMAEIFKLVLVVLLSIGDVRQHPVSDTFEVSI